jgi:hypothetical protein
MSRKNPAQLRRPQGTDYRGSVARMRSNTRRRQHLNAAVSMQPFR